MTTLQTSPQALTLLASLASLTLLASGTARAESLVSRPWADQLDRLGAPEARPRTRKAQVLYPSPGAPSLVRPGQEIVVQVRVRRAMTPPPGIQQPHVLQDWHAALIGRGALVADELPSTLRFPLWVYQIRPVDEGFVYRFRLKTPLYTPPGLYDLEFHGPGFSDLRPRSVRLLPNDEEGLTLVVVPRGERLWQEAEGLSLMDPAAILVPEGLREGLRPLDRWPLATFGLAGREDLRACRSLSLSREVELAVAEAAGCPEEPREARAGCLISALGPEALDPCGDELADYVRRLGPTAYAAGLGDVILLGLDTLDRPSPQRAERRVLLGGHQIMFGLDRRALEPAIGLDQGQWILATLRHARQVLILSHHGPERWPEPVGQPLRAALERGGLAVVAEGGQRAGTIVRRPALIELRPGRSRSPEGLVQLPGLDPGSLQLSAPIPREELAPAELSVESSSSGGLVISIRRPPSGRLRLRLVLPLQSEGGYRVTSTGRPARFTVASPASGDLCRPEQVLLFLEVEPGPSAPLRLEVHPSEASPITLDLPGTEQVTLGQELTLRALVGPLESAEAPPTIYWDLGDRQAALGGEVRHRYLRSGPASVCALAITTDGRARTAQLDLDILRWSSGLTRRPWLMRTAGWALLALSLISVLMTYFRGNILNRAQRL